MFSRRACLLSTNTKRTNAFNVTAVLSHNISWTKSKKLPLLKMPLNWQRAKTTYSTGKHNRSTEASRAKRTPVRASPSNSRFGSALSHAQLVNINSTLKSFIVRNTPEKVNKEVSDGIVLYFWCKLLPLKHKPIFCTQLVTKNVGNYNFLAYTVKVFNVCFVEF